MARFGGMAAFQKALKDADKDRIQLAGGNSSGGGSPPVGTWILLSGSWDDSGVWVDSATWNG